MRLHRAYTHGVTLIGAYTDKDPRSGPGVRGFDAARGAISEAPWLLAPSQAASVTISASALPSGGVSADQPERSSIPILGKR